MEVKPSSDNEELRSKKLEQIGCGKVPQAVNTLDFLVFYPVCFFLEWF